MLSPVPGSGVSPRVRSVFTHTAALLQQHLAQHNGLVVLGVAGGVDERELAVAGTRAKLREQLGLTGELGAVAGLQFCAPGRIVGKPLSQPGARRNLFQPHVERSIGGS